MKVKFKKIDFIALKKKNYLIFIVFLILALILYFPSLTGDFIFDDYNTIILNPSLGDIRKNLGKLFYNFRGLTNLSFSLNFLAFGLKTLPFHLVNVVLHSITAFLLYLILKKLLKNAFWPVFLSSLLFLIHPLQTQAVAYISQRLEVLAALFYLLTIYLYFQARTSFKQSKKQAIFLILACITGVLATMSKETGLTLPVALVIFDLFFISKSLKKLIKKPIWLIPVVIILLRLFLAIFFKSGLTNPNFSISSVKSVTSAVHQRKEITMPVYALTQANVIVRYISLIFVPVGLRLDYDFSLAKNIFHRLTWFNILILVSLLALAVVLYKKRVKLASFGIFFFFIALIPSSSVFPINDVIFEHRMYLPFTGVAFITAFLLNKYKKQVNQYYPLILAVFLILGFLTFNRSRLWGNKFLFWQDNFNKEPGNVRVIKNYGVELCLHDKCDKGIELLRLAVEKEPENSQYQVALAINLDKSGRLEEAEEEYGKLTSLEPVNPQFYFLLGNVQIRRGEYRLGADSFHVSKNIDNDYAPAYAGLCSAYGGLQEFDLAITYCLQALKKDPNLGPAHQNLYVLYTTLKDFEKARIHQRKAQEVSQTIGLPVLY
ncbi:tetratricopeptide repeat protein [Patescibacteria group bacterium]